MSEGAQLDKQNAAGYWSPLVPLLGIPVHGITYPTIYDVPDGSPPAKDKGIKCDHKTTCTQVADLGGSADPELYNPKGLYFTTRLEAIKHCFTVNWQMLSEKANKLPISLLLLLLSRSLSG